MNVYVIGISYKTAPLNIRELLSFNERERMEFMRQAIESGLVLESVFLCTCNRTEIYICARDEIEKAALKDLFCKAKGLDASDMDKYLYLMNGEEAIRHLFKVTCGLDSMIIGEDEILRQIKKAHQQSLDAGLSKAFLNTLFRQAITATKKVKTDTQLSKSSLSIATLTAKTLSEEYRDMSGLKALIIGGTGEIGMTVVKNLHSIGLGKILVTSRKHRNKNAICLLPQGVGLVEYENQYELINEENAVDHNPLS